jgi:hypothetical protein
MQPDREARLSAIMSQAPAKPARQILEPFDPRECIPLWIAAKGAGVTDDTIIRWCKRYGIGRKIGGRWRVSRAAYKMHMHGDAKVLAAYHSGDRTSELVVPYLRSRFDAQNIPQTPQTPHRIVAEESADAA